MSGVPFVVCRVSRVSHRGARRRVACVGYVVLRFRSILHEPCCPCSLAPAMHFRSVSHHPCCPHPLHALGRAVRACHAGLCHSLSLCRPGSRRPGVGACVVCAGPCRALPCAFSLLVPLLAPLLAPFSFSFCKRGRKDSKHDAEHCTRVYVFCTSRVCHVGGCRVCCMCVLCVWYVCGTCVFQVNDTVVCVWYVCVQVCDTVSARRQSGFIGCLRFRGLAGPALPLLRSRIPPPFLHRLCLLPVRL